MAIGNYLCQQGKNEEAESWYDKVMLLAAENPAIASLIKKVAVESLAIGYLLIGNIVFIYNILPSLLKSLIKLLIIVISLL